MDFTPVLQGIVVGFSLAVPIGPIGVLCVRRSLTEGGRGGFVVGLSGASADVIYALSAAFGVRLIVDFVSEQEIWIRMFGALLLTGVGFHLLRSSSEAHPPVGAKGVGTRSYFSTLLLALTNPLTLFAFIAAFSSIGVQSMMDDASSLVLLILGVFVGSLSWFSLLGGLAKKFSGAIGTRGTVLINRIAGTLLILFGVIGLYTALGAL